MRSLYWIPGFLVCLLYITCEGDNSKGEISAPREIIRLHNIRELDNPFDDKSAHGNSHLLPGSDYNRRHGPQMLPDGPCFAVTWARNYEDCIAAFYNARLEMIATWREPVGNGDKVMTVTAGDLDDDGINEILLTTRKKAPGAYALNWNPTTRKLETRWSFLYVMQGSYYRGIEVGNFSDHPGNEVCFGGDGAGLYLLDQNGKLLAHSDIPKKTIQRIDVCDHDGDGFDEMIVSTGRTPGMVHYLRAGSHLERRCDGREQLL
ncbi:hypothetical protein JXJ21_15365 [candidate division KSB1 bacterium]|nr:hypothetical protein [candidate division KSB1 bacterium]